MTTAEYQAAFERELALTLDLEVREILIEAIVEGPGSKAWCEALAILGLRDLTRDVLASPDRDTEERVWRRIERELDRRERRGRFVALAARVLLAALILATGIALGYFGMPALWRWS